MPRRKSAVHDHYRRALDQGDRKIELVECVHCGRRTAGNNAARLFKHLQSGCWPASGLDDPALHIDRSNEEQIIHARETPTANLLATPVPAPVQHVAPRRQPAAHRASANTAPVYVGTADRSVASSPFILVNLTIKDTKEPSVSRLLAVPRTFSLRNLQRAISVAFAYKNVNGMFEASYPAWVPGKKGPPRRRQICIFHDEEQKDNWHAWDDVNSEPEHLDERFVDNVFLNALLEDFPDCKILYRLGPWAHDLDVLGGTTLDPKVEESRGHAICLSGQGHAVLESSDPLMWSAFKDAYGSPTPTPKEKSYRIFYERECATGDPRGLAGAMAWRWDKDLVNRELRLLPSAAKSGALVNALEVEPRSGEDEEDAEDIDEDQMHARGGVGNGRIPDHRQMRTREGSLAGQHDEMMYDQSPPNNRGFQDPPYSMAGHAVALEQLR